MAQEIIAFIKSIKQMNTLELIGGAASCFHYFITVLYNIYKAYNGLEDVFSNNITLNSTQPAIHQLKQLFIEIPISHRTKNIFLIY